MKVVVVSPNEADCRLALRFLEAQGVEAVACASLDSIGGLAYAGVGCMVLVEEALVEPDMEAFQASLEAQPAWSDLPLVLMAAREGALAEFAGGVFSRSGNVTVLQRPLHPVTFISAVNVALRARARQIEVRDLLALRDRGMRQRDEFLAMLAHELRNPLAPVRNAVYLLGEIRCDDPVFLRCRGMIEKQVRHMTRLVDDLLDVSRLELGKVELRLRPVDLNEALVAAVEACAPLTLARRHAVTVKPWIDPLPIRADPVRLEQVIGNLVVNAAKFTPNGGRIEVEARLEGAEAVLCVTDNGAGIKPGMLEAIFELFAQDCMTSARTEGGLGIGLTLVKRLVELHGGTVRATSAGPGAGARFEARFPVDAGCAQSEPQALRPAFAPAPRRVLIVEDVADTRESLGMIVAAWNHDVILAADGTEGLVRAREDRPDIALIDIGLPGLDGYQVAREIRGEGSSWARRVRLIALTGYGQEADRAKALGAGFDLHLLKPVDPVRLKELLVGA